MMDLGPLFRPRSLALIGASPNGTPAEVLGNLRRTGFAGGIVAINPGRSEVDGLACLPALAAHGAPVDLAVIMVKASRVPEALRDCVRAGARSAVVFADGFSPADPEGPALEASLRSIGVEAGLPVLGPNCMGYLAPAYGSAVYIDRITRLPRPGRIALVTQSGSVGVAGVNHTGTFALSAMISVGNEAVVRIDHTIDWLLGDGATAAIAVFAEGIRDGPALIAAIRRARARGVPIVLCKTGRSPAAIRAAQSHTGALANEHRVVRAVLEAEGVAVVDDLDELFAAAELLATGRRFGHQLGAATLSGGHVGLLHDVAAAAGVAFPEPEAPVEDRLAEALGVRRGVANPVDAWVNDDVVGAVERTMSALADSEKLDGLVFAVDSPAEPPTSHREMARGIAAAAARLGEATPKPVAVVTTAIAGDDPEVTRILFEAGIPRLVGLRAALTAWAAVARTQGGRLAAAERPRVEPGRPLSPGTEPETYALLAEIGIRVPPHAVCADAAEAAAAARRIGYPVVAKLVARGILHKTEVAGVALDLGDEAALTAAAERLLAIPGAEAVLVAACAALGPEAIIGARVDPVFGPVLLIGSGGILAELLEDVVVLPAPATPDEIRRAIQGLKLARLIGGWRGGRPLDPEPLIDIADRLGRLIAAHGRPGLAIDLNPVRLSATGAQVLDAKIAEAVPG